MNFNCRYRKFNDCGLRNICNLIRDRNLVREVWMISDGGIFLNIFLCFKVLCLV